MRCSSLKFVPINSREPRPSRPIGQVGRLHRAMDKARIAADAAPADDNGALYRAYSQTQDRFIDAPVTRLANVLRKLELIASLEYLESQRAQNPNLVYVRVILNMLRDLRETVTPPPESSLDVVAIHRAADRQVDEIYRLQGQISGAALVLEEIGTRLCGDSFRDESKMLFLVRVLTEAADDLLTANDAMLDAIDPLNPTVLDEQV